MYKLVKDRGSMANVTLQNTETATEIALGRITVSMLEAIRAEAPDIASKEISEPWDIIIPDTLAKKLAEATMPMKKPKIVKKAVSEQDAKAPSSRKNRKSADIFDLIFGESDI